MYHRRQQKAQPVQTQGKRISFANLQHTSSDNAPVPKNCWIMVNVLAFPTIFISGYFCASRMRLPE